MNKNLTSAMEGIEKIDAMMYAFENCYLDYNVAPEDRERANRGVNAFYALWDAVKMLHGHLDNIVGDQKVVDVVYAVNNVRRHISTLTDEM